LADEKVDINKPVRVVFGIVNQQMVLQNIKMLVQLEKNLPPILANNNRLEQVFFNLITNARDAIYQKKEAGLPTGEDVITVRTYRDKDRVAIAVSDTGIGISRDIRDKIFEPFYTTKEVGKGMGLGLYITYGIVRSYGGEIKIISKDGKGSTFKLTFPCDSL
jgi:signal transduction histidine kinase